MNDIHDIIDPVEPASSPMMWLLVLALAAALVAAGVWWWKRRTFSGHPHALPLTPAQRATALLDKTWAEVSAMDDATFSTRITQALREFIEAHFLLPAPELTTEEFFDAIQRDSRLGSTACTRLEPFMRQCDLVKFARQTLTLSARQSLFETARTFIMESDAPVEPEPQARS